MRPRTRRRRLRYPDTPATSADLWRARTVPTSARRRASPGQWDRRRHLNRRAWPAWHGVWHGSPRGGAIARLTSVSAPRHDRATSVAVRGRSCTRPLKRALPGCGTAVRDTRARTARMCASSYGERTKSPRLPNAVAQINDAAADSVLLEEFKVGARVGRQCGIAPSQNDWPDE